MRGWCAKRGRIEIAWRMRITGRGTRRKQLLQKRGEGTKQADENHRQGQIEGDVEYRRHFGRIGLPLAELRRDRAEERQNQRDARKAIDQVAHGKPVAFRDWRGWPLRTVD